MNMLASVVLGFLFLLWLPWSFPRSTRDETATAESEQEPN
jgi:hypothetical protein